MTPESLDYYRGYKAGIRAARADVARSLYAALGEAPEKNSDLVEIALRVRALREREEARRAALAGD